MAYDDSLAAKREQNIRAREEARAARVEAIKQEKAAKAQERAAMAAKMEAARKEDEQARLRKEEIAKKREENIAKRERERNKLKPAGEEKKKRRAKYTKAEVLTLRQVFDDYDEDNSGTITVHELKEALEMQRNEKIRQASLSKDLSIRKRAVGVDIADLCEHLFEELDKDGDGTVEFKELLQVMFPHATKDEMSLMISWAAPKALPVVEVEDPLTAEQITEMQEIFHIYDRNKDGSLTLSELSNALKSCGMTASEIERLFHTADADLSGEISLEEFTVMMAKSDIF